MKSKRYEASFKAATSDGGQPGEFDAVVAVFDNVDRAGDRLKSTAFDATLKAWRESGDPIPVILSHKWDDPMAIIGHADPNNVKAVPGVGLQVKGQLHVGRGNEVADQVYHLMSERLLKEFSFGFTIPAGGEKRASDGAYDITAVNLIEFGPCLKGVNPETELLTVKSLLARDTDDRRTKSYVEVKVAGSYEEIQDTVLDALRAQYPQPADNGSYVYVCLVATTPTEVTYQLCVDGEDNLYRASYEITDGEATIGEPSEVNISIVPKSDEDIETKSDAPSSDEIAGDDEEDTTPPEVEPTESKSTDTDDPEIVLADLQIASHLSRLGLGLDPAALENARLDDDLSAKLGL